MQSTTAVTRAQPQDNFKERPKDEAAAKKRPSTKQRASDRPEPDVVVHINQPSLTPKLYGGNGKLI